MNGTQENRMSIPAQNVNQHYGISKKKKKNLTQKRLKELLEYNPETGFFTWKVNNGAVNLKGKIAGTKNKKGYIRIGLDYKRYKASRLAWMYVHGYFPEYGIDHKDRIPYHNWIDNLREASQQCNMRNCGNPKNNTSGVKGVSWAKDVMKWKAQIVSKKSKYIGIFESFDEAVCARLATEQCLNWQGCDSSSPAYQYVQHIIKGDQNVKNRGRNFDRCYQDRQVKNLPGTERQIPEAHNIYRSLQKRQV